MPYSHKDSSKLNHPDVVADAGGDGSGSRCLPSRAVDELIDGPAGASAGEGEDAPVGATVDARGHRCPMPLLMAKRGLNALESGQTLCLLATDPGSRRDIDIFTRQSGHELLQAQEQGGEFRYTLRKR